MIDAKGKLLPPSCWLFCVTCVGSCTIVHITGKGKLQTYWIAPEVELSLTAKTRESHGGHRCGRANNSAADSEEDEDRSIVNRAISRLVKNHSSHSDSCNLDDSETKLDGL